MDFSNLTDKQLVDTYMHLMYTRGATSFTDSEWAELVTVAKTEMAKRKITVKEEDY